MIMYILAVVTAFYVVASLIVAFMSEVAQMPNWMRWKLEARQRRRLFNQQVKKEGRLPLHFDHLLRSLGIR